MFGDTILMVGPNPTELDILQSLVNFSNEFSCGKNPIIQLVCLYHDPQVVHPSFIPLLGLDSCCCSEGQQMLVAWLMKMKTSIHFVFLCFPHWDVELSLICDC